MLLFLGKERNWDNSINENLDEEPYIQSMIDDYTGPRKLQGWDGIVPHDGGNHQELPSATPTLSACVSGNNLNLHINNGRDSSSRKKSRKAVPIQFDALMDCTSSVSPKGIVASSPMFSSSKGNFNDESFSLPALKI